jgi:hypothetical protein
MQWEDPQLRLLGLRLPVLHHWDCRISSSASKSQEDPLHLHELRKRHERLGFLLVRKILSSGLGGWVKTELRLKKDFRHRLMLSIGLTLAYEGRLG